MSNQVTAADANRSFSAVLRRVRAGHGYVVTSHGRPVGTFCWLRRISPRFMV